MFNIQKSDDRVNTEKYRSYSYIKKKNCAGIGLDQYRPILRMCGIGSELKNWYRCIPNFFTYNFRADAANMTAVSEYELAVLNIFINNMLVLQYV